MIRQHPFSARATARQAHLRILQTTDLHVHVLPYDYYADCASDSVGLARTATLVAAMRSGVRNTLLFDTGDFLQGNPLGDYAAREGAGDPVHPVIAAMNALGYDAATPGNHDFNYGLAFLSRALSQATFPVVSANALTAPGQTMLPPFLVLDRMLADGAGRRSPIRIGVIGFLPPQTATWDRDTLGTGLTTPDILETAAAHLPALRAAGADLVVALCHSGIGPAEPHPGMENAATALAALPGIDVVLAGHTHQVFPSPEPGGIPAAPGVDPEAGTLCGKPAVMAGSFGSHLGVIDLLLETEGGRWRICAAQSHAAPIAQRSGDGTARALVRSRPEIVASAAAPHRATRALLRETVGRCAAPLSTHFALAGDSTATALVAEAKRDRVAEALPGTAWAGLPVLAAAAPFKAGGRGGPENFTDIPPGPLARRHIADLYPFPNRLRALVVSGAQLRDWIDYGATVFRQLRPGEADQPLLDPEVPAYAFDAMLGASVSLDLSAPARFGPEGDRRPEGPGRVRRLEVSGRPVRDDDRFVVATNSYRAAALSLVLGGRGPEMVPLPALTVRDLVARWVAAQGIVPPPQVPDVTLLLPPEASAVLETAPGARPERATLTGLRAERLGLSPDGFLRVRLSTRAG